MTLHPSPCASQEGFLLQGSFCWACSLLGWSTAEPAPFKQCDVTPGCCCVLVPQLPKQVAARARALQHCNHVSRVGASSASLPCSAAGGSRCSPPTLDSGFSPGYMGIIGSNGSWGHGTVVHWNLSGFAVPEHLGLCPKG